MSECGMGAPGPFPRRKAGRSRHGTKGVGPRGVERLVARDSCGDGAGGWRLQRSAFPLRRPGREEQTHVATAVGTARPGGAKDVRFQFRPELHGQTGVDLNPQAVDRGIAEPAGRPAPPPRGSVSMRRPLWTPNCLPAPVSGGGRSPLSATKRAVRIFREALRQDSQDGQDGLRLILFILSGKTDFPALLAALPQPLPAAASSVLWGIAYIRASRALEDQGSPA
jgi:hypothetical protein